jgi:hypothetical protein
MVVAVAVVVVVVGRMGVTRRRMGRGGEWQWVRYLGIGIFS